MEIVKSITLFFLIIISIIVTWKVSDFFLARREFYVKSRFQILMIKIGWCFSVALFTLIFGSKIFFEKPLKENLNKPKQKNERQK